MPEQPEHRLERQLRAYADQRRRAAGGPFAVPPDTRRALQAEVERRYGGPRPRSKPFWHWWLMWRPGFAWATAGLVAAAVGLFLLVRRERPATVAMASARVESNRRQVAAPADQQPAPFPTPAAARPATVVVARPVTAPATDTLAETALPAAAAASTAQQSNATAPAPTRALARFVRANSGDGSTSATDHVRGGAVQRFVQMETQAKRPPTFSSPPPALVLNDFRIEAAGNRVRITDADGSVYEGALSAPNPPARALAVTAGAARPQRGAPPFASAASAAAPREAAADLSSRATTEARKVPTTEGLVSTASRTTNEIPFTVTGTNRTLNQLVSFEGRLLLNNQAATSSWAWPQPPAATEEAMRNWLSNSNVRGQANVGPQTQLQINAVPTARSGP
jgi:hypothetical protein